MSIEETFRIARRGEPKTVVAGHYEADLDEPIGVGGMAIVYRGKDMRTRREVALKTVRPEFQDDEERRSRFRREARTMAFLSHPNVVRVYDLYDGADDGPWAVLELVRGLSLKETVQQEGPLPLERVSHILSQVAGALDHLHRRGLVHLDVKPQNIILTADDQVKLIDFGIAQVTDRPQETLGGQALGTAAYLAPEQAAGDTVSARTDVYALSCVIYELVTGRSPFGHDGDDPQQLIHAHLHFDPVPPSRIRPDLRLPAWVDTVLLGALQKLPDERYASCGVFAEIFRGSLDEASPPDGIFRTEVLPPFPRSHRPVQVNDRDPWRPPPRILERNTGSRRPLVARIRTRFLWRLVVMLAAANVFLALLLLWDTGEIPGVYARPDALQAGGMARADVAGLNVRDAPGFDAGIIDSVEQGTLMRITGEPVTVDGQTWWPVAYDRAGFTVRAYAAGSYLRPEQRTGRERVIDFLQGIVPGQSATIRHERGQ